VRERGSEKEREGHPKIISEGSDITSAQWIGTGERGREREKEKEREREREREREKEREKGRQRDRHAYMHTYNIHRGSWGAPTLLVHSILQRTRE